MRLIKMKRNVEAFTNVRNIITSKNEFLERSVGEKKVGNHHNDDTHLRRSTHHKRTRRASSALARTFILAMDKRALAATGLLAWAGALQAHMWYMTSSEDYKQSQLAKAGAGSRTWSISFGGLFGGDDN